MSAYDFTVRERNGNETSLEKYKGDVALIVNTATGCGFTPQYEELEAMYGDLKDKGFVILDFPSNQFFNQAPGSDEEIHEFCTLHFGTDFPQFAKIEVIGENASPLFKFLTEEGKFQGIEENEANQPLISAISAVDPDYKNNNNVKWNFTKFLVDRNGNVIERFEPNVPVSEVRAAVEKALEA